MAFLRERGWDDLRPLVFFTDHTDDLPLIRESSAVCWFGSAAMLTLARQAAPQIPFTACRDFGSNEMTGLLATLAPMPEKSKRETPRAETPGPKKTGPENIEGVCGRPFRCKGAAWVPFPAPPACWARSWWRGSAMRHAARDAGPQHNLKPKPSVGFAALIVIPAKAGIHAPPVGKIGATPSCPPDAERSGYGVDRRGIHQPRPPLRKSCAAWYRFSLRPRGTIMNLDDIAHYRRSGYVIIRRLLTADHVAACLAALTRLAEQPGVTQERHGNQPFVAMEAGVDPTQAAAAARVDLVRKFGDFTVPIRR